MALIKCPECGNQISDKAERCPKCGYELNKKETPTTSDNKVASSFMNKGNIKYILIILAIIVAGFLFFNQNNNKFIKTYVTSLENADTTNSNIGFKYRL